MFEERKSVGFTNSGYGLLKGERQQFLIMHSYDSDDDGDYDDDYDDDYVVY